MSDPSFQTYCGQDTALYSSRSKNEAETGCCVVGTLSTTVRFNRWARCPDHRSCQPHDRIHVGLKEHSRMASFRPADMRWPGTVLTATVRKRWAQSAPVAGHQVRLRRALRYARCALPHDQWRQIRVGGAGTGYGTRGGRWGCSGGMRRERRARSHCNPFGGRNTTAGDGPAHEAVTAGPNTTTIKSKKLVKRSIAYQHPSGLCLLVDQRMD